MSPCLSHKYSSQSTGCRSTKLRMLQFQFHVNCPLIMSSDVTSKSKCLTQKNLSPRVCPFTLSSFPSFPSSFLLPDQLLRFVAYTSGWLSNWTHLYKSLNRPDFIFVQRGDCIPVGHLGMEQVSENWILQLSASKMAIACCLVSVSNIPITY